MCPPVASPPLPTRDVTTSWEEEDEADEGDDADETHAKGAVALESDARCGNGLHRAVAALLGVTTSPQHSLLLLVLLLLLLLLTAGSGGETARVSP